MPVFGTNAPVPKNQIYDFGWLFKKYANNICYWQDNYRTTRLTKIKLAEAETGNDPTLSLP